MSLQAILRGLQFPPGPQHTVPKDSIWDAKIVELLD